jgi:hypothetical protein
MNIGSLLYLHKDTLASDDIKADVDFLVELLKQDAQGHLNSSILEHLAYREAMIEGLEEEQALLMMWAARFHGLGHGDHVRKNVHNKLESAYAKEMLEKVVLISFDKKNIPNDAFDYVVFFESLKNRAHLKAALNRIGDDLNDIFDETSLNLFLQNVSNLIEHGNNYRSARVFLMKNESLISNHLDNNFNKKNSNEKFLINIKNVKINLEEFVKNTSL